MARREYKGAAAKTHLSSGINAAATSFDIDSVAGWPTGGANGSFYVTLDPGQSTEERILVGSRIGNTLTSVTRGADDTAAVGHSVGADGTVIHAHAAVDSNEANRHINDTTQDDHTQYMLASGTRHDLTARHQFGGALGTPATPPAVVANGSGSAGSGASPARSDHTHAGPTSGSPVAVGTALGAGSGTAVSLANHVHELGTGSIDTAGQFAVNVLPLTAIADGLITQLKLAKPSVGTPELIDDAVTVAKIGIGAPTNWDATQTFDGFFSPTGVFGRYYELGRLIVHFAGFTAAGGALADIAVNLPFANAGGFDGVIAARGRGSGAGSGLGIIVDGESKGKNIVSIGTNNWGNDGGGTPFAWASGATFRSIAIYVRS